MKVKAAQGVCVPKERAPRQYITEKQGVVDVPDTPYYQLRVRDGDLLRVDDAVTAVALVSVAPAAAIADESADPQPLLESEPLADASPVADQDQDQHVTGDAHGQPEHQF